MIFADRQHLESHLKKLTVSIRTKEVKLFIKNFQTMGTMSTFLCGLGFGCLYMKPDYLTTVNPDFGFRAENNHSEMLYVLLATASIGCNMMVMAVSAYCIIFGTDLAVRGEEGSVSRAVENLYNERRFVMRLFWVATALAGLTGIALANVKFKPKPRAAAIANFLFFFIVITTYLRFRVRAHFKFPDDMHRKPGEFLLSGNFDPEQGAVKHSAGS